MNRPLFSERAGRPRGFNEEELITQIWGQIKSELYRQGLLDEAFGYSTNSWLKESERTEEDEFYDGQYPDAENFYTRKLRYLVDFRYDEGSGESLFSGGFRSDRANAHLPPVSFVHDIDKFFDFLEVTHDIVSLPMRRTNAKKHVGFSLPKGQKMFRDIINQELALYRTPMAMLSNGQIVVISNKPVNELAEEALELKPSQKVTAQTIEPIAEAVQNYLARGSTKTDKKEAVRELADVLESIRPLVKKSLLSQDEKDLFMVANNFAIRHNNAKQKGNYNPDIWLDWMFHINLAAVLTVVKIAQSNS